MRIQRITATQIIIVDFDEIPLTLLAHGPNLEALAKLHGFRGAEVLTERESNKIRVFCHNGVFEHGDHESPVERLELQDRKIQFKMHSSSSEADAFFESLVAFLSSLAPATHESYLRPMVKSEESEIVCHLAVPIETLYSPTYFDFMTSVSTEMAGSEIATAHVKPGGFTFIVDFVLKDRRLEDQRITLSRKEIRLEPRKGHSPADQVYYSKAPFDTDTHIRLLEMLEKEMAHATE